MSKPLDSTEETKAHRCRVADLMSEIIAKLGRRGIHHDQSKFDKIEKDLFDTVTGKLRACTYGSDEYKKYLEELKPALDHHYRHNSHHPEHYENGVDGMSLLDLIEMFADWKAATERHADGDLARSIRINTERFKLSSQLAQILVNTQKELGW